jgi:hypothetical protein
VNNLREHIPFVQLADLVEGRLTLDESARAHLAACTQCAADHHWLEWVIGRMRADRSEDAPPEAIARAKQLFRRSTRPTLRQRLIGALSFDSAIMPLAFGVRSGMASQRQMLFNAGEFDIDLRVAASGGPLASGAPSLLVAGQILGDDAGRRIELRGPAGSVTADINELGEFTLPPVPAGHYSVVLQLADVDIEIPDLDLSS